MNRTYHQIRVRLLLQYLYMARENVMLYGPHGVGKSLLAEHFLQSLAAESQDIDLHALVFSAASSHKQFDAFFRSCLHHRQGAHIVVTADLHNSSA